MYLKKFIVPFLILVLLSIGKTTLASDSIACKIWVDSVFATMTPDQRIGQLFIYNSPAQYDTQTLNTLIRAINEQHIGGILFWDGTIKAQAELTNAAQKTAKIPLMICMDGEWGLSMRLKDGLRYPKKTTLAALTNEQLIYELGVEIGRQCNEMRIHVNFDPVVDVNLNPDNPVINSRSFGDNPTDIARKASLYYEGMRSKNILAVAKHFPGHGDTFQDSHNELAIVSHNTKELNEIDVYPFKKLIEKNIPGIMVGHIAVPAIDSTNMPASLSPTIINGLLKTNLKFEGLVFTDAMKMKGVSNQTNSTVKALLAGNDCILDPLSLKKEFDAVKKAIQDSQLNMELIDQKCKKILTYKYLYGIKDFKPIELSNLETRINTPNAVLLQQKMVKQSVTVLKNNHEIIPVKELKDKHIAIVSVGASAATHFVQTASLYTAVNSYDLNGTFPSDSLEKFKQKIEAADLLIVAIHSTQLSDSLIAQISAKKKTILVFFTSTYQLKNYPLSIEKAKGVVVAYENLLMTQNASAQAIFGGIGALGRLPINTPNMMSRGDGVNTKKNRLAYGTPESVGLNAIELQKIDTIANNAIANEAMPGCQILVARKGVVVYHKSFGYHDYSKQQAVKNTDLYDLASLTKITATLPVLMKLYDENKIELDKKISYYLPELKDSNKKNSTINDLLLHQAGLKAFIPFYEKAIDEISVDGKLMSNKKDEVYSLQVDQNTFAHKNYAYKINYVSAIKDSLHTIPIADSLFLISSFKDSIWQHLVASPVNTNNKKYVYSDLSFLILQKIIEKVAKKPLDELVSSYFYDELGANNTYFNPLQQKAKEEIAPTEYDIFLRKQLLRGYVHDQNAAFMGGVAGHAGLFSNSNDLAKYAQLLLNNGKYGDKEYLSAETCQLFTTYKNATSHRGLGFDRKDSEKRTMYGHTGFTGTCLWIDPKEELIYIFLSNRVNPISWNKKLLSMNVRSSIEEQIYKAIVK